MSPVSPANADDDSVAAGGSASQAEQARSSGEQSAGVPEHVPPGPPWAPGPVCLWPHVQHADPNTASRPAEFSVYLPCVTGGGGGSEPQAPRGPSTLRSRASDSPDRILQQRSRELAQGGVVEGGACEWPTGADSWVICPSALRAVAVNPSPGRWGGGISLPELPSPKRLDRAMPPVGVEVVRVSQGTRSSAVGQDRAERPLSSVAVCQSPDTCVGWRVRQSLGTATFQTEQASIARSDGSCQQSPGPGSAPCWVLHSLSAPLPRCPGGFE